MWTQQVDLFEVNCAELQTFSKIRDLEGTVFVRYASPAKAGDVIELGERDACTTELALLSQAREALQKLGPSPDIGGRKAW